MKVKVYVTLKAGVLDPQGQAVQKTLGRMGFAEVKDARIGKYIELEVAGDVSRARIEEMNRASRIVIALAKLQVDECTTQSQQQAAGSAADFTASSISDGDSLFLATLKDGIEALGGRLEMVAVFADRRVPLME